jgi:serine/threonine protein kinase
MICKQCGEENNERFTYCTGCGASLKSSQPPPAEQSFQSPVATAGSEKAAIARQRLAQAQREQWERLAGEILDGKYRLNSVLEIDPSGATYRATRLKIEDEVAVKIFSLGEEADVAELVDGFFRAAQKAARFKHPNAPAIYDFDLVGDDNRFYVVTELVAGESLRQIIRERKKLSPQTASVVADQVCDALGKAHRTGLIHGDIRPRNIIIDFAPAGGLRATVLNFGLGNLFGARANDPKNPFAMADAWRYLSPEQCLGEEIDSRSDIYGFGIVLYETLGGAPPFNSANPTAVAVQHVTKPAAPLRALNPNVPPPVEAVVMRALEKEKEARQQTAAELARELHDAVFGATTDANRTSSSGEFASNTNSPPPANASATGSFVPASSIPAGHSAPVFGSSSPGVNSDLQLPPPVSLRGDNAIAPPTFASNLSYRQNGSGKFLRIAGFALLLAAVLAAIVAALFWRQTTENGNAGEGENTAIKTETKTGDSAAPGANDPGGKSSAVSSGADDELKRLRAESDKAAPREKKSALERDLKNAESRYPEDYRFTYQRAKLEAATSKSHHEAFEMLFQAGEKAIKDGKSVDLLNDLQSDGSSILKRLTDHKEWKVLENALRKNDSKTLAESGH